MKSLFIAFFVVLFVSCNSDDDGPVTKDYTAINEQEIIDYMAANGLNNATRTNSGLYYIVEEEGEGAEINSTSDVSIRYTGVYKDGSLIFETTEAGETFNLQNTIPGLTEGLQFFREGGNGILLIPSHLAFGSSDYNGIPGGSVLIFEIEIIDYVAENEQEIMKYIEDNDLTAFKSESGSGLYYVIEEPGTGENPTANSNVTVAYKGYFTDGEVFDESETGITTNLNQVIEGWTEGIQFFKEGGSGKLLIPSSLAYGRYGNLVIPGGAVLIFDVNLKSIN